MDIITKIDSEQTIFLTSLMIGFNLPYQIRAPLFKHLFLCVKRYGFLCALGLLIGALIGRPYHEKEAIQ